MSLKHTDIKLHRLIARIVLCVYAVCCFTPTAQSAENTKLLKKIELKIPEKHLECVLEGITAKGQIILWAGLDRDYAPWIDIVEPDGNTVQKFAFRDTRYNVEVQPTDGHIQPTRGHIDSVGNKFLFMENWSIGIYDFDLQKGFLLKRITDFKKEDDFLTHPKWFSDREVMVLSLQGWGTLKVFDIESYSSRTAFASPTMFITDYDVGPSGFIVMSMGPAHERLIRGKLTEHVYSLDETRADKINLYTLRAGGMAVEQITKGNWYDFALKISPNGNNVAFLRGKKKIKRPRNDDKEYTLSDTNPALYVYNLQTKKEEFVAHNSAVKTSYDFIWQDEQTILFIEPKKNDKAIYSYNVKKRTRSELYRTKNDIRSFMYLQKKLMTIENVDKGNTVLITTVFQKNR